MREHSQRSARACRPSAPRRPRCCLPRPPRPQDAPLSVSANAHTPPPASAPAGNLAARPDGAPVGRAGGVRKRNLPPPRGKDRRGRPLVLPGFAPLPGSNAPHPRAAAEPASRGRGSPCPPLSSQPCSAPTSARAWPSLTCRAVRSELSSSHLCPPRPQARARAAPGEERRRPGLVWSPGPTPA